MGTDALRTVVLPRLYRDSVTLMALAATIEKIDGVVRVGAMMGTPANLVILEQSEMLPPEVAAGPDDLVLVVRAGDAATAGDALEAAQSGLTVTDPGAGSAQEGRPGTIAEALAVDPSATFVAISVPGDYAALVAEQALRRGLHVFCFSDNVSLEDEVRLKRLATERRLLMMGPDCGTTVVDGVPLGFANVVRPGPVAIVAASGTGAQEVACLLDAAGTGISQLIGVGGRDLSEEVGGLMTQLGLDLVAQDDSTEVVVLVSKPPSPAVAERVLRRLAELGKPAVACLLGHPDEDGPVAVRGTLEGGARAAARLAGHPISEIDGAAMGALDADSTLPTGILGLYTGGTLAAEAKVILGRAGLAAEVLDLGADEYTAGRPHPMIDPRARVAHVETAGRRVEIGILLVDLVLGYGSSPDPATPLADAVRTALATAAADGRELVVVGSVCGTPGDPQGMRSQQKILTDAGVTLMPSNAAAVRHAAALARRDGVVSGSAVDSTAKESA